MPASVAHVSPISVDHPPKAAPDDRPSHPRAKHLVRPVPTHPAHARSGLVLRTVLAATGTTKRAAARWLDVDERRVREMVLGEDPLSLTRILALPPSVSVGIAAAIVVDARERSLVPLDVDGEVVT